MKQDQVAPFPSQQAAESNEMDVPPRIAIDQKAKTQAVTDGDQPMSDAVSKD
ncbi:hypothetical protein NHX12_012309, partial [Muraenolepis orangiensis]